AGDVAGRWAGPWARGSCGDRLHVRFGFVDIPQVLQKYRDVRGVVQVQARLRGAVLADTYVDVSRRRLEHVFVRVIVSQTHARIEGTALLLDVTHGVPFMPSDFRIQFERFACRPQSDGTAAACDAAPYRPPQS